MRPMKSSSKAHYLVCSVLLSCGIPTQADTFYVTSAGDNKVERYDSSGNGSVFANFGMVNPTGIAYRNGFVYVANFFNNTIGKYDSTGSGTLFANTGLNGRIGLA